MKAVPGILPTLLEMIYFFSTPTIDVEPYFNHLMQIAYKILSHCIYKCNLHLMLVVEILGTFYNV